MLSSPAEIWIVGGGPSALLFPLSRLVGKAVIAVNDSVTRLQEFQPVCFSADKMWVRRHRQFLLAYGGPKYFALPLDNWPSCGDYPGSIYLKRSYQKGLCLTPGTVSTGGNSGYASINLAYHLGAKTINLVGFDMNGNTPKFRQWIPKFRALNFDLNALGVRVINRNPSSAIDAFDREV